MAVASGRLQEEGAFTVKLYEIGSRRVEKITNDKA